MTFKLKSSNNYKNWRDKALTQILLIKEKGILREKELIYPEDLIKDNIKIQEVKNNILFNILYIRLKPAVYQIIKRRINKDNKYAAEL